MDRATTRRSVLRAASSAALLGASATTVQAATSDEIADLRVEPQCNCTVEYRCLDHPCDSPLNKPLLVRQYRECCTCDGGTTCDDWTTSGCCHGIA